MDILICTPYSNASDGAVAALRAGGHRVAVTGDVDEARALLATALCDAVLVTVDVTGFDGHALARSVRALRGGRDMRLIARSADASQGAQCRAMQAGFCRLLVEPVAPVELVSAVLAGLQDVEHAEVA